MPAEWERHEATWLSWPHSDGISFPDAHRSVLPVLARMVDALGDSEPVQINVRDADEEAEVRAELLKHKARIEHVRFVHIPTNEPVVPRPRPDVPNAQGGTEARGGGLGNYNAWGWKYPPFDDDDEVPGRVAELLGAPAYKPDMVLEGGSIDVNGTGTLLTTASCLLNPNRNPDLTKAEIEQRLKDFIAVKNVLWLGDGIEGDDTDGHIDDLTRFVSRDTVVT